MQNLPIVRAIQYFNMMGEGNRICGLYIFYAGEFCWNKGFYELHY